MVSRDDRFTQLSYLLDNVVRVTADDRVKLTEPEHDGGSNPSSNPASKPASARGEPKQEEFLHAQLYKTELCRQAVFFCLSQVSVFRQE